MELVTLSKCFFQHLVEYHAGMGQKCEIPECEELLFGDSARESHMKIKHTKKYSCRYGQVKKYNPLICQNQSMLILRDEIAAYARRLSSRSSG